MLLQISLYVLFAASLTNPYTSYHCNQQDYLHLGLIEANNTAIFGVNIYRQAEIG